jgi:hypothetical protein
MSNHGMHGIHGMEKASMNPNYTHGVKLVSNPSALPFSVYSVYSVHSVYSVYSVYSVHSVHSVVKHT